MAVTLLTPPKQVVFSADLTIAKFVTDNYIQQVGVAAVNKLTGVASHTAGTTIIITYGSTTVVMTAAATPDSSGTQYPAYDPLLTVDFNIVADAFRANDTLARDFVITNNASEIIFTARKKALGFDFGGGYNITNGLPELNRPNFTILFKLYLENKANTGFDLIYRTNLQLLPNGNGEVQAVIGDKLHVAISNEVRRDYPEQPTDENIQCKNSCRRYYFEFAESYDDPIAVQATNTSTEYTVLHGGLSLLAQFKTDVLSILQPNTIDNDRFLTQLGPFITTRSNQPQYLYFFNTRAERSVNIVSEFTFTDNSTHTIVIEGIIQKEFRKYAFNSSFSALYTDPVEGKIVSFYKVYLSDGTDVISEAITYLLDYSNRNFIRYFLNWSSFGALDSRCFYGKGESEFELSSQTAERINLYGEDIKAGNEVVFDSKINRSFKIATGWISKKMLFSNADFFLSNLKYRVTNGIMMPIVITSNKIKEIQDGNNLLSQAFQYRYLLTDHAFTENDNEDVGIVIDGLNVASNYYPIPAVTADSFGEWKSILNKNSNIVNESLAIQYKTDALGVASKVITYLQGQFSLDTLFVGTNITLGSLPSGSRPNAQLIKYFITNNIEMFLVIETNGLIKIISKDGFNLPTGNENTSIYSINLNYKPLSS